LDFSLNVIFILWWWTSTVYTFK